MMKKWGHVQGGWDSGHGPGRGTQEGKGRSKVKPRGADVVLGHDLQVSRERAGPLGGPTCVRPLLVFCSWFPKCAAAAHSHLPWLSFSRTSPRSKGGEPVCWPLPAAWGTQSLLFPPCQGVRSLLSSSPGSSHTGEITGPGSSPGTQQLPPQTPPLFPVSVGQWHHWPGGTQPPPLMVPRSGAAELVRRREGRWYSALGSVTHLCETVLSFPDLALLPWILSPNLPVLVASF